MVSVQNHSVRQSQSFEQSDCFDHHHHQLRESSLDDSDDRVKKVMGLRGQY